MNIHIFLTRFASELTVLSVFSFSLLRSLIDPDLTDDQNSSAEHEDRSTDSDTTGSLENDFSNLANKHANKHQSEEKLDRLDKPSQHPKAAAKPQPRNKTGHNEASLPGQSSQPDKRSRQLITIKRSPSETSMCAQLEQATEYVYQPEESGRFGVDEHSQVDLGGDENKSLLWSLLKQVVTMSSVLAAKTGTNSGRLFAQAH